MRKISRNVADVEGQAVITEPNSTNIKWHAIEKVPTKDKVTQEGVSMTVLRKEAPPIIVPLRVETITEKRMDSPPPARVDDTAVHV